MEIDDIVVGFERGGVEFEWERARDILYHRSNTQCCRHFCL